MIRRGQFLAVSPKTYCAYDADGDRRKMAYKGNICGRPQAGRPASSKQWRAFGLTAASAVQQPY